MIKKNTSFIKGILFGILLGGGLVLLISFLIDYFHVEEINRDPKNKIIIVNKEDQTLMVYDAVQGRKIKSYKMSTGENPGNKLMRGDLKTPEGIFPIIGIEDASDWTYDFKDGKGQIKGAYGPNFLRLKVSSDNIFNNVKESFDFTEGDEFLGIGIHGTHLNDLIGQRTSHGCIRLENANLLDLKQYIASGTLVIIVPGKLDFDENANPKYLN